MTDADAPTATVDAAGFVRAILNASMFACKDDTLPALCTIRLCPGDAGTLRVEATNRYIASQETLPLIDWDHSTGHPGHENCSPPVTALDVAGDLDDMVKLAKTLKASVKDMGCMDPRDHPKVVIAVTGNHVQVTLTDNLAPDMVLYAGACGKLLDIQGKFDNHRKDPEPLPPPPPGLVREVKPLIPAPNPATWAIDAKWLAILAKVDAGHPASQGSKRRPVTAVEFSFSHLADKPAVVTIGENFRALVMPWRKSWA